MRPVFTDNTLDKLSRRERSVARYFAIGLSHKQIAQQMAIAPNTVRNHISRIYRKLAIHDKAALATLLAGLTLHSALEAASSRSTELRQLTVLACCLHDTGPMDSASALTARRDQICAYQKLCHQIVAGYDGMVAHALEENLRIYFGYPQAHADNALRALKAATELIARVPELGNSWDCELSLTLGIATSQVLIGDLIGDGEMLEEQAVIGAAPGRADLLQRHAAVGTILIGNMTRRLLGNRFHYRKMSPISDGGTESLTVWQVIGEAPSN